MLEQERIGSWMQTYSGKAFYPMNPSIKDFSIVDIGHALSNICRYGGHVKKFYSVAEHCVLMSRSVSPEAALFALLHDAAEAYIGDMVRPLKQDIPEFKRIEDRIFDVMIEWLKTEPIEVPMTQAIQEEVREADNRILLDEKKVLTANSPSKWSQEITHKPLGVEIRCWSPAVARYEYLERFLELTGS